jgi:hypothetical protein
LGATLPRSPLPASPDPDHHDQGAPMLRRRRRLLMILASVLVAVPIL